MDQARLPERADFSPQSPRRMESDAAADWLPYGAGVRLMCTGYRLRLASFPSTMHDVWDAVEPRSGTRRSVLVSLSSPKPFLGEIFAEKLARTENNYYQLAALHSGRTPVFDRRTFPVQRSTCTVADG